MRYFSIIVFASLLTGNGAVADTVTVPHTFTAGTPAVADEVNANFDAIANVVNLNDAASNDHAADEAAHHVRYSDDEARAAMGQNSAGNALNHDRYTDAEAVSAVQSASVFQPAYARTVVVSPVGTPAENGTHLVNSLNSITGADSNTPWLLKIEPGVYDVGSTYLVMKPYVDVEGSGVDMTRITSNLVLSTEATVTLADNSELRNLTVENHTAGRAIGVKADGIGQGKITGVTVDVLGVVIPQAVHINNSAVEIDNIDVLGSTRANNYDCNVIATVNSTVTIRNSRTSCSGGFRTTGLYFYNSHVEVHNVEASADSGQTNIGLLTLSSNLGGYSVRVYNSKLTGTDYSAWISGDFDVYIGASQLSGGNSYVDIGTLNCIGVFDENFANTGGYTACP